MCCVPRRRSFRRSTSLIRTLHPFQELQMRVKLEDTQFSSFLITFLPWLGDSIYKVHFFFNDHPFLEDRIACFYAPCSDCHGAGRLRWDTTLEQTVQTRETLKRETMRLLVLERRHFYKAPALAMPAQHCQTKTSWQLILLWQQMRQKYSNMRSRIRVHACKHTLVLEYASSCTRTE